MLVLAASAVSGVSPTVLTQQLVDGITLGAVYALIALGYTLVYGIIELINFAHGDVFVWGSVVTAVLLGRLGYNGFSSALSGFPLVGTMILLVAVAMIFCAVLNFVIERFAYRPLRRAPRLAPLIAAIGVSFILETLIAVTFGPSFVEYPTLFPTGGIHLGAITVRYLSIFTILLGVVLMVLLDRLVRTTKIGRAMRATAQDPEAAALMSVDINRTISFTFIVGGALAGAGSVVWALSTSGFTFRSGYELGLLAFTAAVLGGIGNIYGAAIGGIIIGIIQSYTVLFMGAQWADVLVFVVLVLIFIFKPSGLLGQQVPDKV